MTEGSTSSYGLAVSAKTLARKFINSCQMEDKKGVQDDEKRISLSFNYQARTSPHSFAHDSLHRRRGTGDV